MVGLARANIGDEISSNHVSRNRMLESASTSRYRQHRSQLSIFPQFPCSKVADGYKRKYNQFGFCPYFSMPLLDVRMSAWPIVPTL